MAVTKLTLTNFRSYQTADFELHPEVTIVVGPNASGKTNLLEALYVLATTRSFRAGDTDLINSGRSYFRVVGQLDELELALGLDVSSGRHKQVTHNAVKRTLARHLGTLPVVLFEPTDLDLVSGPPDLRRRYLDFLLSQTDPAYLIALHRYRRILQQRNKLLDGFDIDGIKGQIFAWDLKMAETATVIFEARRRLVEFLNESIGGWYAGIAGDMPDMKVEYVSAVAPGDYHNTFLDTLTRNLPRDLAAGFTTIGPHREDFKIYYRSKPMDAVASRGEVRTTVLAFKLAELDYQRRSTGNTPLLLLDDVFSELDSARRVRLIEQLSDVQTIVTTTDADAVSRAVTRPHMIIKTGGVM